MACAGRNGDLYGAYREQGDGCQWAFRFRLARRRCRCALRNTPGLAAGAASTADVTWTWAHTLDGERLLGEHTVAFVVDPEDAVSETYESNNVIQDRTDALSLVLALTPELYAALETPIDPVWPFSAEDWLQKQIAALNTALATSVYPAALQGATERVRLDSVLISAVSPPLDLNVDGGFWMRNDDRYGNPYYHTETDVSGGLLHELGHQLGLIDLYNLDVALEIPQVVDGQGNPVQMEYWPRFNGLMGDPGIYPIRFAEHTVLALNSNRGYRRGYYGEYLYDVPLTTTVRVLDNQGYPTPDVTLRFYQRASGPNVLGSRHGVIDNVPEITVMTNASGTAKLPNLDAGDVVTTNTGHTLRANPFSLIDVVGRNDEFLVGITKGAHEEYQWIDVSTFNLAAWRAEDVITLTTHAPPSGAPQGVGQLDGKQSYGNVDLAWTGSPDAVAYNVYQTQGPSTRGSASSPEQQRSRSRCPTTSTSVRQAMPSPPSVRRQVESGFSAAFWALRLRNPYEFC